MLPLPLREGAGGRGSCRIGVAPSPQPPPARGGGVTSFLPFPPFFPFPPFLPRTPFTQLFPFIQLSPFTPFTPMTLTILLQVAVGGLLMGLIYGLVAAGLSLIFGLMDVVNFAHGELLMLAMYATYIGWLVT